MVWPCKRFDFTWGDWRFALNACLSPPRRDSVTARIENLWSADRNTIACLTVRSAFDLYLRAKKWDPGDEIIFSALTVPDMPHIARQHGLRPVPLDIDPLTTAWDARALQQLIGPRTRAIVLAHLFGARVDVNPAVAVARRHGAAVVEDCAQAYAGPCWSGHPKADLTLFSFGPMKIATAFGGAIARVRRPQLCAEMRALLERDPVQATSEYLRRVLLYGVLKGASNPSIFAALVSSSNLLGLDREGWIRALTRNVPREPLLRYIRRRPCAALLGMLERRLGEGEGPVTRRAEPGGALFRTLGREVALPTRQARTHSYWMVPVLVRDREAVKSQLRRQGFDAMSERLGVVSDGCSMAPGAERLADALYLPFDPEMPGSELERLGELMTSLASR